METLDAVAKRYNRLPSQIIKDDDDTVTPIEWYDWQTDTLYLIPDYNPFDDAYACLCFDQACAYVGIHAELRAQKAATAKVKADQPSQVPDYLQEASGAAARAGVPSAIDPRTGKPARIENYIQSPTKEQGAYIIDTKQGAVPIGTTPMLDDRQKAAIKERIAQQKREQAKLANQTPPNE